MNASRAFAFAGGATLCCAKNEPQNSGRLDRRRLVERRALEVRRVDVHAVLPEHVVEAPRVLAEVQRPDREAERCRPSVICFAMVTSSAPLAGTLGLPSAPTRPASFMTFMFM